MTEMRYFPQNSAIRKTFNAINKLPSAKINVLTFCEVQNPSTHTHTGFIIKVACKEKANMTKSSVCSDKCTLHSTMHIIDCSTLEVGWISDINRSLIRHKDPTKQCFCFLHPNLRRGWHNGTWTRIAAVSGALTPKRRRSGPGGDGT